MAGKIIVDTIDTDNAFITLNVQQSLIATMNVSGIFSNTGVKMIGTDGTIGVATIANTAITGLVTASQIANVANTQITGLIQAAQIGSANASLVTSGTLPAARLPTGSVLQVVQGTSSTQFDTTSTSFVATNLQVSITPISSSSKIYIIATGGVGTSGANVQPVYTIYRNSTDLGVNNRGFGQSYSGGGGLNSSGAMVYLDSPATTSATTYRVYLRTNGGTATWGFDSGLQVIVVMEIAA